MIVFIDSNIPMYAAGREHAFRDSSRQFLAAVHRGEIEGCTNTEVLQEILYRYSSLQRLDVGCDIYDAFTAICPNVLDVTLADTDLALDILTEGQGLSARDAVHAAVMLNHHVEWIATFDADFDRVPGIRRFVLK